MWNCSKRLNPAMTRAMKRERTARIKAASFMLLYGIIHAELVEAGSAWHRLVHRIVSLRGHGRLGHWMTAYNGRALRPQAAGGFVSARRGSSSSGFHLETSASQGSGQCVPGTVCPPHRERLVP